MFSQEVGKMTSIRAHFSGAHALSSFLANPRSRDVAPGTIGSRFPCPEEKKKEISQPSSSDQDRDC